MTGRRAAAWATGHLVGVAGLALLLGYPVVGPYAAVGLLVLGAFPAVLAAPARWWAAAVLVAVTAAAVVVEVVVPGPESAVLDGERVTTGVAVLDRHLAVWPLVLGLLVLVAAVLSGPGSRRSWGRALAGAAAAGALLTGLVLLAGLGRGWTSAPPFALVYGLPALVLLGAVAGLARLRGGLVTPTAVLGVALVLAVVASWVLPFGDPVAGLLGSSTTWLAVALLLAAVEAVGRAVVRRALGRPDAVGPAGRAGRDGA